MKKIAFASLCALFLGAGVYGGSASALTIEDVQIQIRTLLQRVSELTEQLNTLKAAGGASTVVATTPAPQHACSLVVRDLAMGSTGEDVRALQEYLQTEGYFSGTATGYFGSITAQSVRAWQADEGISAVGRLGPVSRGRLAERCGGNTERFSATPTQGNAPLTVDFDTWLSGFRVNTISYEIDFGDGMRERAADCLAPADACVSPGQNKHTYSSNGTYTATLIKVTNPCAGQEMLCKAAIMTEVVAKQQIHVGPVACTKEYRPVCGAKPIVCITTPCNPIPTTYGNACEMRADSATLLYDGQCRGDSTHPENDPTCKAWYDGCNSCSRQTPGAPAMCTLRACSAETMTKPYCSAYFGSGTNKAPTISRFSGPTTLSVNTEGTWTIAASDPENGQLSYQIWWGDEHIYAPSGASTVAARDVVQNTTFTHSYATAGTYTVTIVVRDAGGESAKTSSTVQVGAGVACTMEYSPVCGQPPEPACRHSVPACMMATPGPQTYGNRCTMNAAGATFLYAGECSTSIACTADAMQCSNGQWVGRTGPNCQFVCN